MKEFDKLTDKEIEEIKNDNLTKKLQYMVFDYECKKVQDKISYEKSIEDIKKNFDKFIK